MTRERRQRQMPCSTSRTSPNEELRELLDELYAEEQRVSYRRRVLHGKIDILRSELVRRLKAGREAGRGRHQRARRRQADRHPRQRPARASRAST